MQKRLNSLWILLAVSPAVAQPDGSDYFAEFAGFETGGMEEINSNNGGGAVTTPSPWTSDETYVAHVQETEYFSGASWSTNSGFIFAVNIRFDNLTDIPNNSFTFLSAVGSGGTCWYMTVNETPRIWLYDADGNLNGTFGLIPTEDTWYRLVFYWELSDSGAWKVWFQESDEPDSLSGSGSDDLLAGSSSTVAIQFNGPTTTGGTPCNLDVDSYYVLQDAEDTDLIGPFRVVGPWQTDASSATSDCGLDALVAGDTWDEIADTPTTASSAELLANKQCARICDEGATDGPAGDARITGADQVWAGSFIFDGKKDTKYAKYGSYASPTCTIKTETITTFAAGYFRVWLDNQNATDGAVVPDADEYAILGWKTSFATAGSVQDAWAFSLVAAGPVTATVLDYERNTRGVGRGVGRGVR